MAVARAEVARAPRPLRVLFLGSPGAGHDTQAARLAVRPNHPPCRESPRDREVSFRGLLEAGA